MCLALLFLSAALLCAGCSEKSTPADTTAPAPPTLLPPPPDGARDETGTDAVPEGDWVQIMWRANDEDDLRGYRVYRSSPPLNTPVLLTTRTVGVNDPDTVYDDQAVELNVRYSYTVTAFDGSGNESAGSGEVDYMLITKLGDENLTAPRGVIDDRQPEFSWTSTGVAIENYLRVFDTVEERTVWVSPGQNPFNSPHAIQYNVNGTALDDALVRGREYRWRVDRTGSELHSGSESHWVSFTIAN
jgi:hypothetical protein